MNLILSCQPGPLPGPVAAGIKQPLSNSSNSNDGVFRIQDWAGTTYGYKDDGLLSLNATMSYSGVERRPATDTIPLMSIPNTRPQEYALLLTEYVLDANGKQYPVAGRLAFNGGAASHDEATSTHSSSSLNFVADLESTDGIHFSVKGGQGYGNSLWSQPDGVLHGNIGICGYGEYIDYSFDDMAGSVTVNPGNSTFQANLSTQNAEGVSKHTLSPWQCSYQCTPGQGAYNEECANPLTVTGSIQMSGKVNYTAPEKLEAHGVPDIFSPANQDSQFDYAGIVLRSAANNQIFRFTWPNFNGSPLITETGHGNNWSSAWHGKIDETTYYPDGRYPVEVESDVSQRVTTYVRIDNTPPKLASQTPMIVNRNGKKAVEVIVEDPEINGVRAGLSRDFVQAQISSNRPGRWHVSLVNLDNHRVLVSGVFSPDPTQTTSGDYEESLYIYSWDKVFNRQEGESVPFDFNQPAQTPSPTPIPTPSASNECEDAPLLLPDHIRPLINDVQQIRPIEPQVLNKHRNYSVNMENTADQLRALGVNVPNPTPVIQPSTPPGFGVQNVIEKSFHVASAPPYYDPSSHPSYNPSSNPSGMPSLTPKAQRLYDKYNSLWYEHRSYRESVLNSLQEMDGTLHQLLLNSTEVVGSTYDEDAYPLDMSFEDYKAVIDELHEEFLSTMYDSNTYSLVETTQVYANVALVYDNLLKLFLLGHLPSNNIPTDTTQTQYFSDRLEEITQPWQLVNFTANRLKTYQNQIYSRFYKLEMDVNALIQESKDLEADLNDIEKNLETLLQKANSLGIHVDLSDLQDPSTLQASQSPGQGDFSVQMAAVVIQVGLRLAPLGVPLFRFALNALRAYNASETSSRLETQASKASKAKQTEINQLNRQIADPKLSALERGAKEALRLLTQQVKDEVDGVMQMARGEKKRAAQLAKDAQKQKAQSEQNCKEKCIQEGVFRKPKPKTSDKDGSKDAPSWAKEHPEGKPYVGENGNDFATRLCNDKFGKGKYNKGPGSEYNKIKKWGNRAFLP